MLIELIFIFNLHSKNKAGDAASGETFRSTSFGANSAGNEDNDVPSANKLARLADIQRAREEFSARLDKKIKKPLATSAPSVVANLGDAANTTSTTSLSEAMSIEKIAALKVMVMIDIK